MNIEQLKSIKQVSNFLKGSQPIAFEVASSKDERYAWVAKTLAKFKYRDLNRTHKGGTYSSS